MSGFGVNADVSRCELTGGSPAAFLERGQPNSWWERLSMRSRLMDSTPSEGQVLGFRTSPYSEYAPKDANRFGAVKVLGVNSDTVVMAVLSGTFETIPTLEQAASSEILRMNRLAHKDVEAVFAFAKNWWSEMELTELTPLGHLPVSSEDYNRAQSHFAHAAGTIWSGLRFADYAVEGEWRWEHDRARFMEEQEKIIAREEAKRKAQQERYENRLRNLTWDQLLAETPLPRWTGNSPFPSRAFTDGARQVLRETMISIQELGDKPKKKDVRAFMKSCVAWFNANDEAHGGPIETEEREDICMVLEEIAFVAKHKSLVHEVDEWRTW